ncbi:hypothetical protein D9M68_511550 [compost metagenome]
MRPGQRRIGGRRVEAIQLQAGDALHRRQAFGQAGMPEQQRHARVAHDEFQALGGMRHVQRQVGGAGLEHRQQRHRPVQRTRQRHADHLFRTGALGDQQARQAFGAGVQLGEAQAASAAEHGDLLRRLPRPAGDAFVHRRQRLARRQAVGLGANAQRLAIVHADLPQRACGAGAEAVQQMFQVRADRLHLGQAEELAEEHVFDFQAVAEGDHQVHGEVGHAVALRRLEAQLAVLPVGKQAVHRRVLEHDDAVEQRLPAASGPALDLAERRVLVLAGGEVVVLQLAQPVAELLFRARRLHDRQGVDEQPEGFLRPRQRRRPPGNRGAEGHAALPGVALQQEQPGGLHHGVQGHPLTTGEVLQARAGGAVELRVDGLVAAVAALARQRLGEQRRLFQRRQLLAPEAFAEQRIAGLQPVDVVAVAPGRRQRLA